jgi:hypothetical protein
VLLLFTANNAGSDGFGKHCSITKKLRIKQIIMQNKLKVSLAYNTYPDGVFDETTTAILGSMTGNAAFLSPTVPMPIVSARQIAFRNAMAAAANGGTPLTAAKKKARQLVADALDANALYVQSMARYDLAMFLTSGYQVVSSNRAQTQLPAPAIVGFDNEMSKQLVLRLSPVANAYCYEVQTRIGTGPWQPAGSFTAARRIILTSLTPGTIYTAQARAIGGSTGYSDWSDPSSHMAM